MKPMTTIKTIINTSIFFVITAAITTHAANPQSDHEKIQELNTSICILASQGAYTAAVERQAGTSKKQAKKVLEQDLQVLKKNFSQQSFLQFLETAWLNALDIIYEMPIQDNDHDKEKFISEVMEVSLVSCLNDMQA